MRRLRHYDHVKEFALHLGEVLYLIQQINEIPFVEPKIKESGISRSYQYYLNRLYKGDYYI